MILLGVFPCFGQEPVTVVSSNQLLRTFLTDGQYASEISSFDSFLKKLERKKASIKKEKDFVRYVFSKTHQEYLKKFSQSASFKNLFRDGSYNCLTGTILYSIILNHFEIEYEVIETNYHIFLTVETGQGKVLLEATDALNGFVDTPQSIEEHISQYRQNTLYASNSKLTYYQFNFELFNPVSLEGLQGLLYYNMAVDSYNRQNLQKAIQFLVKAHKLYSSSRIDEFSQILLLSLQQSNLDAETKTEYIKTVLSIRQEMSPVIASR